VRVVTRATVPRIWRWHVAWNADTFRRMAEVFNYRSHKLTQEVVNTPIRKAAEFAWKSRDYGEVKSRYLSVQKQLTDVEGKRLDYARRHLNNG
jgi:hypothetical protein